jgi:G6PDH family F420-dependent oxidoreductase
MEIGYKLSSEEFEAALVDQATRAEQSGFDFALISDHFHPWTDRQGQSPFVWAVLGAIARATSILRVGTAVTCPTIRIQPAIVAQAAATTASLMPGRFFLGLGTGENLNEHVVGQGWPAPDRRVRMLEEAIEVIRLLWGGGLETYRGCHFTVENARLYSLPEHPPEIMVAGSKPAAARLAGRLGDAFITTEPDPEIKREFDSAGGKGKPAYLELTVCFDEDERRARKTAREIWSLAALGDGLMTELALPSHFEAAFEPIGEDRVAEMVVCGPDPAKRVAKIQQAHDAGFTNVCVHQVGPNQEGFFEFYASEVLPKLASHRGAHRRGGRDARRMQPARAGRGESRAGQAKGAGIRDRARGRRGALPVAHRTYRRPRRRDPAAPGVDQPQDLVEVERLREVAVDAHPARRLPHVVVPRVDQHRDRREPGLPELLLAHAEAVEDGHVEVQHDEAGLRLAAHAGEGFAAVTGGLDRVACDLERVREHVAHVRVVVDDEDGTRWRCGARSAVSHRAAL